MEHSLEPYTPEDVAALLKCSTKFVWRLCRDGELPAVKLGRNWFIKRREFDAKLGLSDTAQDKPARQARPRLADKAIW
jgi:excisionase family DNA binding protein